MMAIWWNVTYNQYSTSLRTRNRRLNLPDTLFQVTLGPCQRRICHGKMDAVCLPNECSDITPTGSVLNPRVRSNLDWRWTLASKCSVPAAHCSGSHGKSQGHRPGCSRNITSDVTANSECLFPVSGWLINSSRSVPKGTVNTLSTLRLYKNGALAFLKMTANYTSSPPSPNTHTHTNHHHHFYYHYSSNSYREARYGAKSFKKYHKKIYDSCSQKLRVETHLVLL